MARKKIVEEKSLPEAINSLRDWLALSAIQRKAGPMPKKKGRGSYRRRGKHNGSLEQTEDTSGD